MDVLLIKRISLSERGNRGMGALVKGEWRGEMMRGAVLDMAFWMRASELCSLYIYLLSKFPRIILASSSSFSFLFLNLLRKYLGG